MHQFQKLTVWQKSMDLVKEIYDLTSQFPLDERYGLSSQMRRSSVSIPSNIAEGSARNSQKEFKHYITIASGSANELFTQTLLSERIGYITEEVCNSLIFEITHILNMLFKLQALLK